MKLTDRETKIARLALDKGAKNGERQAAAIKLIESLYARGVSVEELDNTPIIETVYRNVYRDPEPPVENAWTRFVDKIQTLVILAPFCLGAFAVIAGISTNLAGKPASPREPEAIMARTLPTPSLTPSIESANELPTPSAAAAAVATPTPGNDWYYRRF
jgi:hypothetical protein